ncbi:MAG: NUDIX domain-containing protein [Muribaculaceae bacterium]|nr:NUDIX domain-containing protein [Muribaculaceae bacterium]
MNDEIFPIVDEAGNVIGKALRKECHSGSKILHPVVHLHIFNDNKMLYLQRRSMNKDIQPGKWDSAVGGHVDLGESIDEAMRREASEELGLKEFEYSKLFSYIYESNIEREMVNTFATFNFCGDINIDHVEIDEGRFWSIEEIMENLNKGVFTPNFEHEFAKLQQIITSL